MVDQCQGLCLDREFVTFLPVIFVDYYSLVIAAEIKNEETNWNTFIQPFHWDLWCVLILVSLIVGTWLHLGNFGLYFDKVIATESSSSIV